LSKKEITAVIGTIAMETPSGIDLLRRCVRGLVLCCALAAVSVTACGCSLRILSPTALRQGSGSAGGSGGPGSVGGGETTTEAAHTVDWVTDSSGSTEYYTNDPSNLESNPYSVWTWSSSVQNPMTTVEASVRKLGGDPSMGFGLIFCVQDANNFLVLYIDLGGYYCIGRVQSGTYTPIVSWTDANASSTVLYEGYGATNDIAINYQAGTDTYQVSFNNTAVTSFTDSTWSGGAYGFIAGLSASESFPTDPVDVRFHQTLPAQ